MIGQIRACAWIIGLLGFPGNQAILDIDLPRTRTRAIDSVRGAHHFVVLPARTIGVLPTAVFVYGLSMSIRKGVLHLGHELQPVQKMTHCFSPWSDTHRSVDSL